jgi:hypothetical protein
VRCNLVCALPAKPAVIRGDEQEGCLQAAEHTAAGQAGSARRLLQRVLELRPREPSACFALGQVLNSLFFWQPSPSPNLVEQRVETMIWRECLA